LIDITVQHKEDEANNIPQQANNVIKFPKKHLRPEVLSDQLAEQHQRAQSYYASSMAAKFIEDMNEALIVAGIPVNDKNFTKDLTYLYLNIYGLFGKTLGLTTDITEMIDGGKFITIDGKLYLAWGDIKAEVIMFDNGDDGDNDNDIA
jgi:hypothetical protein